MVSPIVIVTGSVDQIKINNYPSDMNKNVKLSGFTSWVGRTSCEVTMKIEQENIPDPIIEAKFLMVARSLNNKGPGIMNPLEISNEKEKAIFDAGEANKLSRIEDSKKSLNIQPPNAAESLEIHEMFKQTIDLK